MRTDSISLLPVTGIGEISSGDDLATVITAHVNLAHGDIVVVTSKVVSKAEGRVLAADRDAVLASETDRMVATRGATSIVRTRHGLVMAAAGVDASNTQPGTVVLLPTDPDASARVLRERLAAMVDRNVAVVVTDTAGRAWRNGQTDIAIGAAGLETMHDYAGTFDDYGNPLEVTAPAVADEIAGAADLVKGKVGKIPVAVLRGLADLVLPAGTHGPGARALVRPEEQDMFGYGAREAVLAAVAADPSGLRGFGRCALADELVHALRAVLARETAVSGSVTRGSAAAVDVHLEAVPHHGSERRLGRVETQMRAVAFAMGWPPPPSSDEVSEVCLRFRSGTP